MQDREHSEYMSDSLESLHHMVRQMFPKNRREEFDEIFQKSLEFPKMYAPIREESSCTADKGVI